jgi:acyl-CoA synthetase (NDP forming)
MAEIMRNIIEQALAEGRTYLMEHESKAVLECIKISTSGSRVAKSEDEAVEIFQSLGTPVVLKVLSPEDRKSVV